MFHNNLKPDLTSCLSILPLQNFNFDSVFTEYLNLMSMQLDINSMLLLKINCNLSSESKGKFLELCREVQKLNQGCCIERILLYYWYKLVCCCFGEKNCSQLLLLSLMTPSQ